MPASGLPFASANPCIVAMPMRSPVNDPGPDATANRSTSADAEAVRVKETHQITRQPHAVRDCGVARVDRDDAAITRERHASLAGCRVESEHQHVKFNSTCLPLVRPSTQLRAPRALVEGRRLPQGTHRTSRRRCASISMRSSSIATRSCFFAWGTSTRCSTRTRSSPRARSI